MSTSRSRESVRLRVEAFDRTTEIYLVDSSLKRVAEGASWIECSVPAGLYKVRFRSGSVLSDRLIELKSTQPALTIRGEPVPFASAAPLSDTRDASPEQASAAEAASLSGSEAADPRSEILLFVRDPKDSWVPSSVRLLDLAGGVVADLAAGRSSAAERWCSSCAAVVPGTYRVQVDTESLGRFEMSAVAAEGFQTQIFLAYGEVREREVVSRVPRLRTASVLMSPIGVGFRRDSRSAREADLLRLGLASGRYVLTPEFRSGLLTELAADPTIGIYAGHMEVARRRSDHTWVRKLLERLSAIVPNHPDVQALSLPLKGRGSSRVYVAHDPPMLRSSWRLITTASRRRALVEPSSPLDRMAEQVLANGPWLLTRGTGPVDSAVRAPVHRRSSDVRLGELVNRLAPWSEGVTPWTGLHALSPFETGVFQAVQTMVRQHDGTPPKPDQLVSSLSRSLGMPLGSVKRVVSQLEERLRGFEHGD